MLTSAQRATLKTAIQADPSAITFYETGDLTGLADYLNAPQAPAYTIWRTHVPLDEIMQNGFDWVRVDNLSVGKARIWEWLFSNESRAINPSKPNVRLGIDETWKGTQADLDVRAAVYAHCKRTASRFERVFATGAGTDPSPGTSAVEGPLSFNELIGL